MTRSLWIWTTGLLIFLVLAFPALRPESEALSWANDQLPAYFHQSSGVTPSNLEPSLSNILAPAFINWDEPEDNDDDDEENGAIPPDPGKRDTVQVGRVTAYGAQVVVPVTLVNDERLIGVTVSLDYSADLVQCDSVSFANTRLEAVDFKQSRIDQTRQIIQFAGLAIFTPQLPEGAGAIAYLHFTVTGSPTPDNRTVEIDSFLLPPFVIILRDHHEVKLRRPLFIPGGIDFITSGVGSGGVSTYPYVFALDQNSPNPFNPTTKISFSLAQTNRATLVIYNVIGQKVRTLVDEILSAGRQQVVWDGNDDSGSPVTTGIYFARLQANGMQETRKMMMLK